MHAWLTSNMWSSLEVWFWRVQLWLGSFSPQRRIVPPRGIRHILRRMDEKRSSIKKKSNFILPFMCKCAAIYAFDSDRVPDSSLYWRVSPRGFILQWVRSWDGDKEAAQLLIENHFSKFLLFPSKQGTEQRREPRVMNYGFQTGNSFNLLLCYWLVQPVWRGGENMQHVDGCNRDESQQQWTCWATSFVAHLPSFSLVFCVERKVVFKCVLILH